MDFEWIARLQEEIRSKVLSIQAIWHEIGIEECRLPSRKDSLSTHVLKMLDEMYEEDFLSRQALVCTIDDLRARIQELHADLESPEFSPSSGKTLLMTEKILYGHYKQLTNLAATVLDRYRQLRRNEQTLATRLGEQTTTVVFRHVPNKQQMQCIQANLDRLSLETQSRLRRLDEYRQKIKQFSDGIGDEFLQKNTLMIKLLANNTEEDLPLTPDFLDNVGSLLHECERQMAEVEKKCHAHVTQLRVLASRLDIDLTILININQQPSATFLKDLIVQLDSLKKLRGENISKYLANCCQDLRGWWTKCCLSRDDRNEALVGKCFILGQTVDLRTRHTPPGQLDPLLEELDNEISKWATFYEQHHPLFEALRKWQETFEKFRELESKRSDPATLKNRGGILLTIQRQYNITQRELKRCELVLNGISLGPDHRQVEVYGMPVCEYIADSHRQYEEEKENCSKSRTQKTSRTNASSNRLCDSTRLFNSYSAKRPGDKRQHRNLQQGIDERSTSSSCFTVPVGVKKSRTDWIASTASRDKLHHFQPLSNPFLDFLDDYSAQHGPLTSSPILRVTLVDCNDDQQQPDSRPIVRSATKSASRDAANTLRSANLSTKSSSARKLGQQTLTSGASNRRYGVLVSSGNLATKKITPEVRNNTFRSPSGCPVRSIHRHHCTSTPRRSRVGLTFR